MIFRGAEVAGELLTPGWDSHGYCHVRVIRQLDTMHVNKSSFDLQFERPEKTRQS